MYITVVYNSFSASAKGGNEPNNPVNFRKIIHNVFFHYMEKYPGHC